MLAAAPENDAIMSVENGENNLCDIGGRDDAAVTGAYTYTGVGDGSVDGDDEIGLRRLGDDDVAAPSVKGIANDIVGKE